MAKPNQIKAKKKNPDAVKGVKKQSPQQKRSSKLSFSNALGRIRKKFEASKSKVNKQLKDLIQPLNTHILPNLANEDWSATGNGQVTYNLAALAKIRQETQRKASIKPRKTHDQLLQKYQEDLNQAVVRVVNMMDLSLLPGNEGENDDSSCVRLSTRMFNRRDVEIEYEKAVEAEKQLKIKREPANDVEVIELDTTVEEEIVCLGAVGKSPTNKEKSNKQNDNNTCMERSDSELKQPTFDPLMNSNGPTKSRQPLQSFKSWITQSEPLTTFKSWVTQSQSSSTDSRSSRTDTNGNKTTTSGPTTEMQSKPNHPQFTLFSKRKEVEIPKINLQYMTRTAPTASSSRLQNNPPSGAFFNKPSTATYSESAIKKTVSNVGVPTKKLVKSTSEHLTTPPIDPKTGLPERPLLVRDYNTLTKPNEDSSKYLRVCSYNVLCEKTRLYCSYLYPERQQQVYGDWAYRYVRIMKDIEELNADVYALQEVQNDHYEKNFKPQFKSNGYTSHYVQREGTRVDGCMLAFRQSRFDELYYEEISYNYNVSFFDRDNVAQLITLYDKLTNSIFCVTNTHILFHMSSGSRKLAQLVVLMAKIHEATDKYKVDKRFKGVFVCGDFNLQPKSPLYTFMRFGHLRFTEYDLHQLAYCHDKTGYKFGPFYLDKKVGINPQTCSFDSFVQDHIKVDEFRHDSYRFFSAYEHETNDGLPEVSTFHIEADAPDFIFYTGKVDLEKEELLEHRIKIRSVLSLPSLRDLQNTCGSMPNKQLGSDHLPILAVFHLEP